MLVAVSLHALKQRCLIIRHWENSGCWAPHSSPCDFLECWVGAAAHDVSMVAWYIYLHVVVFEGRNAGRYIYIYKDTLCGSYGDATPFVCLFCSPRNMLTIGVFVEKSHPQSRHNRSLAWWDAGLDFFYLGKSQDKRVQNRGCHPIKFQCMACLPYMFHKNQVNVYW